MKGETSARTIRSHSRTVFYKAIPPCENCGYSKHVEVCHIVPVASFPDDSLLRQINARSNLACLCPNCHWEFDHGMISLLKFRPMAA
jgi:hypothetical protein